MSKEARKDKAVALHDQIRNDLATHYPMMHLFAAPGARVEVRGTFPDYGDGGGVLDRFQVTFELPAAYPRALPLTRETSGRIPWTPNRHMDPDGKACVLLPDGRWRVFPLGARFIEYLKRKVAMWATGDWEPKRAGLGRRRPRRAVTIAIPRDIPPQMHPETR